MADLTPDRLARLRVWATRHDANRPNIEGAHVYDGACPWCRGDHLQPGHDGYFDGNAHDLAIELLDEIDRLRAERVRVADAIRQLATDTDGRGCYDALYDLADELDSEFEPDNRQEATHGP